MIDELLAEAQGKMDQAIAHTVDEFSTVRTGRANPGILHRITVDYYGRWTNVNNDVGGDYSLTTSVNGTIGLFGYGHSPRSATVRLSTLDGTSGNRGSTATMSTHCSR